jgi:tetratricopeptide (TPR) repeat protein
MQTRIQAVVAATLLLGACGGAHDPVVPDNLVSQARRLDLAGDHDAAVTLFRQALEAEPDSFDAQYGLGRALDLAGDYEQARVHFVRAVDLAEEGAKDQALRMLGVSWTFSRNAEAAARAFSEVYDRRLSAGNFAGASEVANELGRVYLELGELDSAEHWYRTGYEAAGRETGRRESAVDLANLRWAHARARIAARRGLADEAQAQEAEVKRLVDKGTNTDQQVQYAYLVGYVELHLGNYEAALEALAEADGEDPFIALLEAQAHEALGQGEMARAAYARVLTSTSHAVANAIARPTAREKQ